MKSIYDYSLETLTEYFVSIHEKKFRARQVFEWLYLKKVTSFDEMTNLPETMRETLKKTFMIYPLEVVETQVSKDGTTKLLSRLEDGGMIETVLMRFDYGQSVCITTQLGCNMGCRFCASGLLKKQRNLTSGEMVAQVMMVNELLKKENLTVTHIVIMGTGEPFDNYEEVMKFIRLVNAPQGLAIGARHMTVSTCGLCPKIDDYADEGIQTNLAISLHAPNDQIRDTLMPINHTYPMDVLRNTIERYIEKTHRRVTFEYILLEGVNDDLTHARQLAHYVRGLNAYVNLIPYNAVDEHGYKKPPQAVLNAFHQELLRLNIPVTLRKEHGSDIDAACGQLRAKKMR